VPFLVGTTNGAASVQPGIGTFQRMFRGGSLVVSDHSVGGFAPGYQLLPCPAKPTASVGEDRQSTCAKGGEAA
jgi:hypothetical protein